jgi:hypothetical protein
VRNERRFSEGADTKPPRGDHTSLEAFCILVPDKAKPLERWKWNLGREGFDVIWFEETRDSHEEGEEVRSGNFRQGHTDRKEVKH